MMADPDELVDALKDKSGGFVFVDSGAVCIYGARLYAKIKVACQRYRIILLCDLPHRDLIKEAVEFGVYGCILEPYAQWEVLSMVRPIRPDK